MIPLTKPYWGKREQRAVVKALQSSIGTGDGPFTQKLVRLLQDKFKVRHAIAVTSCTHGLELVMASLKSCGRIKAGDEVILPSFTMSSTANCVILTGAKPVFADIEPDFYCIDPKDIARKITSKTKAIIVVHYAGMPCRMEEIGKLAKTRHLSVIEDAAHAIGAIYKGKPLGTWGDAGVYSFHGTKNVSCGEGGAVLTNDDELIAAMDIYRANGTNRKAFLDGIVDKYSWVDIGTSFYLSDILASILIEQVEQINTINIKRQHISTFYYHNLSKYSNLITLPEIPPDTKPNWHIFAIRLKNYDARNIFIREMRRLGIEVSYHYVPLHTSAKGLMLHGKKPVRLPVTEAVSQTLVRLPIYPGLSKRELTHIITSARKVLKTLHE